ncbi:unnamed protein product [Ranitomeya imitator]|uniref:IF rod domain-containing protein n=1 Tax=Ranitomeya imitator TaxID=111125 RepID=A0ABN9KSZ2_9NEOB|nr:unnamed protein product [Ranitomeya imitator]
MSSASATMASMGGPVFSGGLDAGSFGNNSKETMNNLNDRLATYLERVRSLEQVNNDLEVKIREFYERKSAISAFDPSGFYETISKLRAQILNATTDNARLILQIDNAKLAADDFKIKFETELAIRELSVLKGQIGGKVNVELDSAPPVDLSKILAEVREQYEEVVEKNRQEVETWYRTQSENLRKEVAVCKHSFESSKTEITESKRRFQSLELELQSLLNMKRALEGTLAETEGRYGAELAQIQNLISQIELDLQQVRSDYENHSVEYTRLLNIKIRLEQEIATYRRLLEGEDISILGSSQLETRKSVKIISKEQAKSSSTTTIKKRSWDEMARSGVRIEKLYG